jgi:hypothetical protein
MLKLAVLTPNRVTLRIHLLFRISGKYLGEWKTRKKLKNKSWHALMMEGVVKNLWIVMMNR